MGNLHLELCVENFHIESVVCDFLLADAFRLSLVALLIAKGQDFMVLGKALDQLWLYFRRLRLVGPMSAGWVHPTDGTAMAETGAHYVGCAVLCLAREHHQTLVMLFRVLLFQFPCLLPGDIGMLDSSKVCSAVCFDDDEVAGIHLKTGVFLNIENIGAVTLEGNNIQTLALVRRGQAGLRTAIC